METNYLTILCKMSYFPFMVTRELLNKLSIILLIFIFSQSIWYLKEQIYFKKATDIFSQKLSRKTFDVELSKEKTIELAQGAKYRHDIFTKYYRPIRNSDGVNCSKLIHNDRYEIFKAKTIMNSGHNAKLYLNSDFFLNITRSCSFFRNMRGYIQHPLSEEERTFPIAFSILAYTDIEQVERLLRLIYRPQNYYCIHIDLKMRPAEKTALKNIASCFKNVVIAKQSVNVTWGNFSLLQAELVCMETLWPFKAWKYYMNLAGQEFPLKTNRYIVAALKALDGAIIASGKVVANTPQLQARIAMKQTPAPHGIRVTSGSMHIAANRFFVDFCIHDTRARDFLEWLKSTHIPDELFFSSINYNPHLGIPGTYLGKVAGSPLRKLFLRYVIWHGQNNNMCRGFFVRNVCILGVEDLSKAYSGLHLFANKFHLNFEHLALDCLEEVLYELTWGGIC